MCLNIGTSKSINFPFGTKLMFFTGQKKLKIKNKVYTERENQIKKIVYYKGIKLISRIIIMTQNIRTP